MADPVSLVSFASAFLWHSRDMSYRRRVCWFFSDSFCSMNSCTSFAGAFCGKTVDFEADMFFSKEYTLRVDAVNSLRQSSLSGCWRSICRRQAFLISCHNFYYSRISFFESLLRQWISSFNCNSLATLCEPRGKETEEFTEVTKQRFDSLDEYEWQTKPASDFNQIFKEIDSSNVIVTQTVRGILSYCDRRT